MCRLPQSSANAIFPTLPHKRRISSIKGPTRVYPLGLLFDSKASGRRRSCATLVARISASSPSAPQSQNALTLSESLAREMCRTHLVCSGISTVRVGRSPWQKGYSVARAGVNRYNLLRRSSVSWGTDVMGASAQHLPHMVSMSNFNYLIAINRALTCADSSLDRVSSRLTRSTTGAQPTTKSACGIPWASYLIRKHGRRHSC